ncbi:hypothetical protein DFJ74DRAFT_633304 [Hyaloraphidium curvatum]|nr:hypothetical protein DFJ74DRAFT_633304 [Hyaloraphidium curvatum]
MADDYPFSLGAHSRKVTAASPAAQTWFDRGAAWGHAFNHQEARWCFRRALDEDPACLMAMWGLAANCGPHYNNPEADEPEMAAEILREGLELLGDASRAELFPEAEKALFRAMAVRHLPPEGSEDSPAAELRAELDLAYADAMRRVYEEYGQSDADIIAVYIESLMQLSPWRLWKDGKMADDTKIADILALLDEGLALQGDHPALLHFHIHAYEMSPDPGKSLEYANRLRLLVPDGGHLVHMPSHVDMLVGDYSAAILANELAVVADRKYLAYRGPEGFYTLYRFHDLHLLVYAAMFAGIYEKAISAAQELASTPSHLIAERPDWLEAFVAVPYHVWIRFGKWDEILAQPAPEDAEVFCTVEATRLYARAVALASLSRPDEAEAERLAFEAARARVPASRTLFNNTAEALLAVSSRLALGEVLYRRGEHDGAFSALREGARLADELVYDEPEGQMQPVRHALGALLLEQGRVEEAEGVLREDLGKHPKNLWALRGLAECLERTGRGGSEEAGEVRKDLERLAGLADTPIDVPCFCRLTKHRG